MTDEITSTKEARAKLNELLDEIEKLGWWVVDYDPTANPFEPLRATIKVERYDELGTETNRQGHVTVPEKVALTVIRANSNEDHPASMDDVKKRLEKDPVIEENPNDVLNRLKKRGDVYQPSKGTIRVT